MINFARQALGPDAFPFRYAHAPTNALNQVVALRVSFDDSTVENGPLRVLPPTHPPLCRAMMMSTNWGGMRLRSTALFQEVEF
jgi:Phytanoyl-CoA dioxygenase (PhyH)